MIVASLENLMNQAARLSHLLRFSRRGRSWALAEGQHADLPNIMCTTSDLVGRMIKRSGDMRPTMDSWSCQRILISMAGARFRASRRRWSGSGPGIVRPGKSQAFYGPTQLSSRSSETTNAILSLCCT